MAKSGGRGIFLGALVESAEDAIISKNLEGM